MFLRFTKTWSIIFVIVVFMLLLIVVETYRERVSDETTTIERRNYVSRNVEECSRIQILCVSDREYFSDETGCGCELVSDDSDNNGQKSFCSDESRNADVCIEIYQPVCGFPISQTFSNSCFACINSEVEYYVQGECK